MKVLVLVFCVFFAVGFAQPAGELVVLSTEKPKEGDIESNITIWLDPVIYEMDIHTNISNRFAKTLVTSKVKNPNTKSQETTFSVILPDKAFISEFVLRIGGKDYKAYVREKEEAAAIYKLAKLRGQTAGHVALSDKSANEFKIAVNVEAESKAVFLLTFEELLERKNEQYELILDVHPGQVVDKLNIEVHINESRPLRFVRTPSIRTGNEISKTEEDTFNNTDIQIIEKKSAVVKYQPDGEEQREFARSLGRKESEGVSGQFVVQYDVERDPSGGEVLLQDGYFVHFFAPDDLQPLPKHIVFVLDTSGSMGGAKMNSLKDAMKNILDQLQPEDYASLVEFNTGVYVWDLTNETRKVVMFDNYEDPFAEKKEDFFWPAPLSAEKNESVESAKHVIDKLYAGGSTNIIGGLETALVLLKTYEDLKESSTQNLQPIIMFLTDGTPVNSPVDSADEVFKLVTNLNTKYTGAPIFALSFGDQADKVFLRKLSLKNSGFSRHIFESAYASFQLQNFYNEISVPLMSNITFEYVDTANVTQSDFPVFFKGTEIAICGTYDVNQGNPLGDTKIHGSGNTGDIALIPTVAKPVSSLERLWAYLTVKQILDKRDTVDQIEKIKLKNQALELALKYSFVTEVTSLVVVRPEYERPVGPIDIQPRRDFVDPHIPQIPKHALQCTDQPGGLSCSAVTSSTSVGSPTPVAPARAPLQEAFKLEVSQDRVYAAAPQAGGGYSGGGRGEIVTMSKKKILITRVNTRNKSKRPVHKFSENKYEPATTYKPTYSTTTAGQKLEDVLTWLPSVLNPNGTLSIKQDNYKLGENDVISNVREDCPKTPLNETTEGGKCALLKECPQVYPYLTDLQIYETYFCSVDKIYVGVCCPKKWHVNAQKNIK